MRACILAAAGFSAAAVAVGSIRGAASSGGIAFVRDEERVYFMDADGGRQRPTAITGLPTSTGPIWSPNGREMVFSQQLRRGWRLVVARADGTRWRTIVRDRAVDGCLEDYDWSPGSRRIAYSAGCDLDFRDVYVVGRDGKRRHKLRRGTWQSEPRWSPTGDVIAFAYLPPPHKTSWFLFLTRPDGTKLRKIPGTSMNAGAVFSDWAWARDGKRLFFVDGSAYEVVVVRRDGKDRRVLSGDHIVGRFSLSRDGRRIAMMVSTQHSAQWDIYVMNTDGSAVQQLTNNRAQDRDPQWSPDGRKIAFTSNRDGNQEIYAMNADGTEQTNLTNNPADDSTPRWMPDG